MNTFLLCSGVFGDERGLQCLRRMVQFRKPDGLLFAGGVLPAGRCYQPKVTLWGMTRDDGVFVERFFETLGDLQVPSAVIPGWGDTPVEEFLRLGMNAEVEFPSIHLVHATLWTRDGVAITGIGGWISEGAAWELDCCSRTLAQYCVRSLQSANQPHKILLLARPSSLASETHCRSLLCAELIDSLHPDLCVVGGGKGDTDIRRVAHTLIVKPGALVDGRAAWLDWRREAEHRVQFLDGNAVCYEPMANGSSTDLSGHQATLPGATGPDSDNN